MKNSAVYEMSFIVMNIDIILIFMKTKYSLSKFIVNVQNSDQRITTKLIKS